MRKSAALALALLGLFVSLYLWWVYASPEHALVCIGTGCDVVRASRYSHVLGYPVPLYGVLFYSVLALLIFAEPLTSPKNGARLRQAIGALAAAGFVCAAGLTALEAFVIHAWCAWCVVQAIAVTLLFLLWLTLLGADDAGVRDARTTRHHAVVLLLAMAAGVPGFWLLRRRAELPPPPAPAITMAQAQQALVRPDSHVAGNPQAAVTLVEFGDLQCPACVAAHPTMRELRRRFGHRVRFVFRQFPLATIHHYALRAAAASECAGRQGKFWEGLDRLYRAEGDLGDAALERYASELGLDLGQFRACLADPATRARIDQDIADGHALGVRATPTFFVGRQRIEGPLELPRFARLLNDELAQAGQASSVSRVSDPGQRESGHAETRATQAAPGFGAGGPLAFNTVQGGSTDCSTIAPTGPEPEMVHTPSAQQSFGSGALFVDVRPPEDYAKGHIQGALSLPMIEAERRATELPKDRAIVLYESGSGSAAEVCAASRAVGRVLLSHGYKNVVVYQDGLAGWQKASLPSAP